MRKLTKYTLIWLAISALVGALGAFFLHMNFWISAMIVGLSLIANGLLAEWEDRRRQSRSTQASENDRD
jgi:membrane protein implicated in regulation of membrane protease activity